MNIEPPTFPLADGWLRTRAALNLALAGGLGWGAFSLLRQVRIDPSLSGVAGLGYALAAVSLAFAVLGVGKLVRRGPARVVIEADACRVPPDTWSVRERRVYFDDLDALVLQRGPRGGRLVMSTASRVHLLPVSAFRDDGVPGRLYVALREAIAMRPGGLQRLDELDRGLARTRRMLGAAGAPVTQVLLGAIIAGYAAQSIGQGDAPLAVVRAGANVPVLVREGQLFRLVSAAFLHGGLLHVLLNGLALHALGGLLERLLGGARLFAIYAPALLAGSAASLLFGRSVPSIGASGAVFGLLGALAVLQVHPRARLPVGMRQSRRWWTIIVALQVALPLAVPSIDWLAHAGGFAVGALATALLVRGPYTHGTPAGPVVRAVAWGLAALMAAALGQAAWHARQDPGPDARRTLEALLQDVDQAPDALNLWAWTALEDPAAAPTLVDAAGRAARVARDALPDRLDIRDTLATALYRQGHVTEALIEELAVLEAAPDDAFMATQVARFFEAHEAAGGGPLALDGAPAGLEIRAEGDRLWLSGAAWAPPISVLALVRDARNDVPIGVLRASFTDAAGAARGQRPFDSGEVLVLLAVRGRAATALAPNSWVLLRDDPRSRALPTAGPRDGPRDERR